METVGFRPASSPPRLTVVDRVQSRQYALGLSDAPSPQPLDPDGFDYPVERAVAVETEHVGLQRIYSLIVRSPGGEMLEVVSRNDHFEGDGGEYVVEVCAPVKTYLRVDGPVAVTADDREMAVTLDGPTAVAVGVRPYLAQPTAEVTTTDAPGDVARAIEATGSSLQTTSPERSFPTLRGHPPRIRLGGHLDIPAEAAPPETGITVVVRPDLRDLYAVAPAVHYLGASVTVGDTCRAVTETGFEYPLDDTDIAASAGRLLQQNFLMDCLARVHGRYRVDCVEYDRLADDLPVAFETAYDRPPAERFERYMGVAFADIEEYLPRWPLTACVEPAPESLAALPYLLNELALVEPVSPARYTGEAARSAALDAFVAAEPTRAASAVYAGEATFVDVPETPSTDQVWVGEDVPLNANKFVAAGHRHRHERAPDRPETIRVHLVCNDADMLAEVHDGRTIYGSEGDVPFDLEVSAGVGVAELREALAAESHLLHFVGHANEAGLECPDGTLDVSTLDAVGAEAFLLNACQSYRHGVELVERGSIGGVVTLSEVGTDAAGEVGLTLARLLDQGFSLRAALDIARTTSVVGGQYLVVGDDSTAIAQNESIVPYWCVLEDADEPDRFELSVPTSLGVGGWGLGTVHHLGIDEGKRFLAGRTRGPMTVTASELRAFLDLQRVPVRYRGELYLGEEVEELPV